MTLTTACTPRVVITGNGTLGPYSLVDASSVAIRLVSTGHLKLTRYAASTDDNNDGTLLVLNTDYSVGGTQDARTFTLIGTQAVLTSSQRIVAERVQSYTQDLDLTTGGAFNASSLESRFDKIAEFQQELKARLDRVPALQFSDATANVAFPSPPTSTTQFLARNTAGEIAYATAADLSVDVTLGTDWATILGLPAAGILDNLSGVRFVSNNAALTALTTATGLVDNGVYHTLGRSTERDGGEGLWVYDSALTTTANVGTILAIDGGGAGRFFRLGVGSTGPVNALWFASTVNAGIKDAITAGFQHIIFDRDWTWTSAVTPGASCIIEGVGRSIPTVTRGAVGTMFDASAAYCEFRHFIVQGAGATYTNTSSDRVFIFSNASNGNQYFDKVSVFDSAGPCWEVTAADAGYLTTFHDCSGTRTTTTNAAVVGPTSTESSGARDFINWRGGGSTFLRPNGMINTRIVGGDCTNFDFAGSTSVSLRMMVSSMRIASGAATLDIAGADALFDNCSFSGNVTFNANSSRIKISNYTQASGKTIVDNSTSTGDSVNEVVEYEADITPTWKGDSADPSLGNGTLTGRVRISGRAITVTIQLTCGSTTTYGTGNWYFNLPAPYTVWVAKDETQGSARILDTGTAFFAATADMAAGSKNIYVTPSAANSVNATVPMTWATGDTLYLTITFEKA